MTHADKIIVEAFLDALRTGADLRRRKVRRMRAAIRSGAYENQLKLEIAADRMAADLMGMEMLHAKTDDINGAKRR